VLDEREALAGRVRAEEKLRAERPTEQDLPLIASPNESLRCLHRTPPLADITTGLYHAGRAIEPSYGRHVSIGS
jgi:hypothetical protein